MPKPTIHLHHNDLPADVHFGDRVAVDSETLGLRPHRDRLCVVQLSAGDNTAHLVQFDGTDYSAPNLKALMANSAVEKIFHYARFDIAVLRHATGVETTPIFCTKIASKLARTYTDRHGLKDLVAEIAKVELSKQQQSSDWAATKLSPEQQAYAASDVLYLHTLRDQLADMLVREGRMDHANAAFQFLSTRAALDLAGFEDMDIFSH